MESHCGRGKFIVIDGIDGAGKSLQTRLLQERLESRYAIACLSTREPGGSPLGEKIRSLLLQEDGTADGTADGTEDRTGVDAITEALLFNAARRDHLHRVIAPALDKGLWVLCDRFAFSSFAYQGAGGASLDLLKSLHRIALSDIGLAAGLSSALASGLEPDLGIVLDLSPERAMQRFASKRGEAYSNLDNFERRDSQFFSKVRAIFLQEAGREPNIWSVIDASETIERVADRIEQQVVSSFSLERHLPEAHPEVPSEAPPEIPLAPIIRRASSPANERER